MGKSTAAAPSQDPEGVSVNEEKAVSDAAAYIRALQLSQHAEVAELPEADRRSLQSLNP